ncbi:MAG: ABC transporter substrate-binding protein [Alphaproteobacteria bacterium]|nr:ABC transporter substrate-binding protein [Alphaproteobacteria bacterium]
MNQQTRGLRGAAVAIGIWGAATTSAQAQQAAPKTNELVVVTWGGTLQEQQRDSLFRPFSTASGIRVREDTGPQIERSRAEVRSGKPSFDTTATNLAFYLIGKQQDLWAPVDYQYFDKADLAAMPDDIRLSHGVGAYIYAHGMNFSTKAYPAGRPQPNSWADFWDVRKFPGKRSLADCGSATRPVPEAALLADDVPMDKLYPIDIPRAVRKLKELAPHVIWWKNPNQPGQLLATGEVTMAMAPTGRIQTMIDEGAPMAIVWNQSQWTFDIWYALKGAPNADNAMRFLAFAMQPDQQAKFAKVSALAPSNPRALALIDPATTRKLPTHPDNFRHMYKKDEAWWENNRDKWAEACLSAMTR